jgi:hypothetical protein
MPMSPNPQPLQVSGGAAQLADVGVTEAQLLAALAAGVAVSATCTANHPPMAAGFYAWAETVVGLAEQLGPEGWTREDFKNFSTVVRGDGRVAIAVASADAGAGDLSLEVMTRSPKGVTTLQAITRNLLLPFDAAAEATNALTSDEIAAGAGDEQLRQTWFLLQNRRDGMLHAELSLPQAMDERGFVLSWARRIPLAPLPLDLVVFGDAPEPPVHPTVTVTPHGTP